MGEGTKLLSYPRQLMGAVLAAALVLLALGRPASAMMDTPALEDALRAGGYVIFLRHAEAIDGSDLDLANMDNCATQRNLSARGREDAKAVGRAFRNRAIPVGRILASPFCRTRHTAYFAFGADRVVNEYGLKSVCETTPAETAERTQVLRRLLATAPAPETNTLLVSHNCNIRTVSDETWHACARTPGMGDAVVFRPEGSSYALVGCLPLDVMGSWADMTARR